MNAPTTGFIRTEKPAGILQTVQSDTGTFTAKPDGIYYAGFGKDGQQLPEKHICAPLHVLAKTRSHASTEWGRLLEWRDDDGTLHRWAMPMELLKGDSSDIVGELLRRGLYIQHGRKNKVVEYVQSSTPFERITCTDKTGWHGGVYVTPERVYGADAAKYIYQNGGAGIQSGFEVSGTLAKWRESVARYAAGNSRLAFSISAAFAGSLIALAGIESGGFHFNGGSKDGKTTVQLMAGSVFGHPDKYKRTWRATSNGLEGVATLHNDGFLILDEIKQCTPKEAGEVAYMLANGQDKTRQKDRGGLRESKTWRLLFLSSGEMSLIEYLKTAGIQSFAGQEVRLANLPADAGKGLKMLDSLHGFASVPDFFTHINAAMRSHHGAAGVAWLEALTLDRARIEAELPERISKFVTEVMPENASTQADTVAKRAALVAIAGELATGYGITGWEAGEATAAAKRCFHDWLAGFGTGDREEARILDAVRAFVERNGDKFENMDISEKSDMVRDLVGFHRPTTDAEGNGREYIILASQMERLVEGFNVKQAIKVLQKRNWINPQETDGTRTYSSKRESLPRLGRTRCYILNSQAMNA